MDFLQIGDVLRTIVNDDLALVATLTFFICEAIFMALPPEFDDKLKQLTALLVGGFLGLFVIQHEMMLFSLLHGMAAGGAATIIVAKFKASSKK